MVTVLVCVVFMLVPAVTYVEAACKCDSVTIDEKNITQTCKLLKTEKDCIKTGGCDAKKKNTNDDNIRKYCEKACQFFWAECYEILSEVNQTSLFSIVPDQKQFCPKLLKAKFCLEFIGTEHCPKGKAEVSNTMSKLTTNIDGTQIVTHCRSIPACNDTDQKTDVTQMSTCYKTFITDTPKYNYQTTASDKRKQCWKYNEIPDCTKKYLTCPGMQKIDALAKKLYGMETECADCKVLSHECYKTLKSADAIKPGTTKKQKCRQLLKAQFCYDEMKSLCSKADMQRFKNLKTNLGTLSTECAADAACKKPNATHMYTEVTTYFSDFKGSGFVMGVPSNDLCGNYTTLAKHVKPLETCSGIGDIMKSISMLNNMGMTCKDCVTWRDKCETNLTTLVGETYNAANTDACKKLKMYKADCTEGIKEMCYKYEYKVLSKLMDDAQAQINKMATVCAKMPGCSKMTEMLKCASDQAAAALNKKANCNGCHIAYKAELKTKCEALTTTQRANLNKAYKACKSSSAVKLFVGAGLVALMAFLQMIFM